MATPRVVIIGGGFGGLATARALRRAPVEVVVLDSRNHHLFQPLLYQVATAGLSPGDIAEPIRHVLRRQANASVLLAKATGVDIEARTVQLSDGELRYDYLVVATGAGHSYFGNDAWAEHAPGLKTVEDALEIRRRVLFAFERAERTDDPAERDALLTFVVVGGGATGVELAGALAELSRHTLARNFRRIDPARARVILCEGGGELLGAFAPPLRVRAKRQLEELGVEVRLHTRVLHIDDRGVRLVGGELPARTVLWAAGVAGSPLGASLGAPLDRAGRVKVQPDLTIPWHTEVFVIGDLAAVRHVDGSWVPGVAPAAIQMGRHAAECIRNALRGEPHPTFRYFDKGSMATVGRRRAVAQVRSLHLSGALAWLAWLSVHLVFLVGFRNRVLVLLQWAWAYFSFQRGARLITGPVEPMPLASEPGVEAPHGDEHEVEEAQGERDGADHDGPVG